MPDHTRLRSHPRQLFRVPVRVKVEGEAAAGDSNYALNLSAGGACLQSFSPRRIGSRIRLAMELDRRSPALNVDGIVAWCRTDTDAALPTYQMGVRFTDVTDNVRSNLDRVLRQISRFWPSDERGWASERHYLRN